MSKALIRHDQFGLYVLVGGYAFRPSTKGTKATNVAFETKVNAHHIAGTQIAKVDGETWRSFYADPRYMAYQDRMNGDPLGSFESELAQSRFIGHYKAVWSVWLEASS